MKDGVERFKDDLRSVGLQNPVLLTRKLERIGLNRLELDIMKLRYIDGLLIKQMPDVLNCGERWIKSVHSVAIIKALDRLSVADLVEMGIHFNVTPKTLYLA
jgi:hypothetical protein